MMVGLRRRYSVASAVMCWVGTTKTSLAWAGSRTVAAAELYRRSESIPLNGASGDGCAQSLRIHIFEADDQVAAWLE